MAIIRNVQRKCRICFLPWLTRGERREKRNDHKRRQVKSTGNINHPLRRMLKPAREDEMNYLKNTGVIHLYTGAICWWTMSFCVFQKVGSKCYIQSLGIRNEKTSLQLLFLLMLISMYSLIIALRELFYGDTRVCEIPIILRVKGIITLGWPSESVSLLSVWKNIPLNERIYHWY